MSLENAIGSFKNRIKSFDTNQDENFKNEIINFAVSTLKEKIRNSLEYQNLNDGQDIIDNIYCVYENGKLILGIAPVMVDDGLDKATLLEFGTGLVAQNQADNIREKLGFAPTQKEGSWVVTTDKGTFRTLGLSAHRFMRDTIDELKARFKIKSAILRANGVEILY